MKIKQSFLFILIFLCLPAELFGQKKWEFYHLDSSNGLSNNSINTIFQDSEGLMWFGTWDGLNRYDGANFKLYTPQHNNPYTLSHQVVRDIIEENKDYIWIVTDYGLNRLSKRTGLVQRFFLNSNNTSNYQENAFHLIALSQDTIIACYNKGPLYIFNKESSKFTPINSLKGFTRIDDIFSTSSKELWIQSANTLFQIFLHPHHTQIVKRVSLPQNIKKILYDSNHCFWYQQKNQLFYYDTHFPQQTFTPSTITVQGLLNVIQKNGELLYIGTTTGFYLNTNKQMKQLLYGVSVLSLHKSQQELYWIGTDGQGIYEYHEKIPFIDLIPTVQIFNTRKFPIRAIYKDIHDNLWIGSKGGGLVQYSTSTKKPLQEFNVSSDNITNSVLSLCPGNNNNIIWIGTDGFGLKYYSFKDNKILSCKFIKSQDIPKVYSIYKIIQDNDSTLYLGGSGCGLLKVLIDNKNMVKKVEQYTFQAKKPFSISNNIVYAIINDKNFLWIGTRGGGLNLFNKKTKRFQNFKNQLNDRNSLINNDIISLYKDKMGRIWVGTVQGLDLLIKVQHKVLFRHFNERNGLSNSYIHNIQEDSAHNIWVSTSKGVSVIDKQTFKVTNYYDKDGLQSAEFSDGAGFSATKGRELFFGGINGLNIIYPEMIVPKNFMPRLILNQIQIDNKNEALSNELTLEPDFGTLRLSFSILDYLDNNRCNLSYKIVNEGGFASKNNTWISIDNNRDIIINRLTYGTYTLYVRQSNANQTWSSNIQKIQIHVKQPIYLTWYAIVFYILVFSSISYLFYSIRTSKIRIRKKLEKEKQDEQMKEELHHAKLQFFTNITYDFSNIITLIYGSIEQILQQKELNKRTKLLTKAINMNVNRMNTQIQQLTEFYNVDIQDKHINYETIDINDCIKQTLDNFLDLIEDKAINLQIIFPQKHLLWVTDKNIFEKIIYNIFSNAVKYTYSNENITLKAQTDNIHLKIELTYNGPAIQLNDITNIVSQYEVLNKFEHDVTSGSPTFDSINISLCHNLIKFLKGHLSIKRTNREDSNLFTVLLPKPQDIALRLTTNEKPVRTQETTNIYNPKKNILLIEDIDDLTNLINNILEEDYNVTCTKSPEEALESLKANTPNLIIYDINIPDDNNIKVVEQFKTNEHTQYIPIIILSANSSIENTISTLEKGANLFIAKPFRSVYLKTVIKRTLQEKDLMQSFSISSNAYKEKFNHLDLNKEDKKFLYSTIELLKKEL